MADYITNRGSQASRGSLRAQVRDAFRKHQGETDPVEIEKQKDAAIRGLSNYMFYEAQRMAKEANWGGRDFMLVDTGGLMSKADERASVFWEFGIEPIAVSAISGSGTGELLDLAVQGLPPPLGHGDMEEAVVPVSMAIVGRPNVGKSSLLNSIVGKERSIVSSMAGTTRDAIDTDIDMPDGRRFKLIDTAGVRKRASIASGKDGAEPLSVERAFHAVRRAEVAVLVIDATEGVTQQDFRLSEYVAAEGRACVVVVNKWDKVPDKGDRTLSDFEANVRAELRPVEWANIVFTSALTGQRVKRVLDAATAAAEEHSAPHRIPPGPAGRRSPRVQRALGRGVVGRGVPTSASLASDERSGPWLGLGGSPRRGRIPPRGGRRRTGPGRVWGWWDRRDAWERLTDPHNPQTGRTRSPPSRAMVARQTTEGVLCVGATPVSVPPTGSASVGPPALHLGR